MLKTRLPALYNKLGWVIEGLKNLEFYIQVGFLGRPSIEKGVGTPWSIDKKNVETRVNSEVF